MFQNNPEHIILNKCKSFTINKKKNYKILNNIRTELLKDGKYISLDNIHSPKKENLIEKISQTNILKKTIKISLNKYHNYIKKLNAHKNNNKRPFSYNINKNLNNNREEIVNNYNSPSRNKISFNSFNNSLKERKIFSSNNNSRQKLNILNIGIYSPINKDKSKTNIFNDSNSFLINGINNNKKVIPLKLYTKLKSTKFSNKTKNINGNKNIQNNKRSPLSTYNILLDSSQDKLIYKAINDIILNKLTNNKKKIHEQNKLVSNKIKNDQNQIENVKYFDFLPIILNHLKHKTNIDDLKEEYNKYLTNNKNRLSIPNKQNKINKIRNPIVRYLFLENIINNLKHIVKFINIKKKEEIEQNVIKVIGEEYSKLENNNLLNSNDFSTYGYEYVPKYRLFENYKKLKDKGLQTSKVSEKKSLFFINEKKLEEENNTYSNNELISPKRRIFLKNSLSNKKIIDYNIKLIEEKHKKNEDLKNELNEILSEKKLIKNKNKNIEQKEEKQIKLEFFKENGLKNLKNIQKSRLQRSASVQVKSHKPKFIKINLNKLKINDEMKKENIKRLDSTDKMNNPPSLEIYKQQKVKNEEEKNESDPKKEKKDKKNINNIKNYYSSLKNDLLTNRINQENNNEENKEKNNEENKENKNEENAENEENSDEEKEEEKEKIEITKETLENLKNKTKKFTRRYKKALKEKKKMEKIYKKTLENHEIALREIRRAERQRKKTKKSVFNELMNQGRQKSLPSEKENENKDDNYSSISDSKINSQLERIKNDNDSLDKDENINNNEDSSISSVSEISKELEEFNEVKNVITTKKKLFEDERRINSYRRRGGIIIPSPLVFKSIIKIKELSDLNDKMKHIYDNIYKEKKREENKKRRKKRYKFNFIGIDKTNIRDIEIRKKVHLARIKEDIRYKISQGKYHFDEFDFFQKFEKAMNNINLSRFKGDEKRIKEYVHTLEKYFQLFYYELLNKEREKIDEDRINKFLYTMHEEVGTTIPYVKYIKGKKCRASDYNKEINLCEINSSNNL